MRPQRNDASTEKAHKQRVLNAADYIIAGGDLPGDHLVRMIMCHLKRYVDPVGYRRSLHPMKMEAMRADLAAAIAKNRRKGINAPVTKARAEVAERWGRNSGDAVAKALEPNRRALRPRRRRKLRD
jgi:hypothetical protein